MVFLQKPGERSYVAAWARVMAVTVERHVQIQNVFYK